MLGIRGLDAFGAVHAALGLVALICGAVVLLRAKGTGAHRRIGGLYVAAMTCLNVTGLAIYDLYGHFGPFHVAALVSLATVAAGYVALYLRRPRGSWTEVHAIFFCWSYVGLWAAFVSEVVVRLACPSTAVPSRAAWWPLRLAPSSFTRACQRSLRI